MVNLFDYAPLVLNYFYLITQNYRPGLLIIAPLVLSVYSF